MIAAMSNKEFVLSVFDKNTPSNLVVENILSRTGLDGEEPFAEENRARLEVACAKQIPWMIQNPSSVSEIGGNCEVHPLSIASCHFHQRKRFFYVLEHSRH